jgi:translation initiation factor IF-1
MVKEAATLATGRVVKALPGARFQVELDIGEQVIAYAAGRLRKHFIRIVPGDRVTMELSPYDLRQGRIIFRGEHPPRRDGEELHHIASHLPEPAPRFRNQRVNH